MTAQKRELRAKCRRERKDSFREHSSANVDFEYLADAPEFSNAKCVTSYFSINDEPDTHKLNRILIARGITVLLPRIEGDQLRWVSWAGNPETLVENRGLREPQGQAQMDLSNVGVVIVPSLHVDQLGYRLGQGGGFYDRALPHLPGWKVGLVYEGEFGIDEIPREDHDIRLDAVATPEEIIRFK